MARRIEIELTSSRPDGSWTWRAAGALQPRGVLDGTLLHEGAKPGDVVKADAEFEIDGISIVAIVPPREKHRSEPQRIELLAPTREAPGVTTQLTGRGDRRGPGRSDRRGPRPEGGARPRPAEGRQGGAPRERREGRRPERSGTGQPPRDAGSRGTADGTRTARPAQDRPNRGRPAAEGRPAPPARTNRRLSPGNAHRQAVLDGLAPEERPIAEQVLRGGIPAVRTAIHLEREKATAEGRPAPQAESLVALAESLLPRLKAAEWRDRAEAARQAGDNISLRDLRSVVAGADVARDDESRALAAGLREALDSRLARLHTEWTTEITKHLDENRVVRALRLAGRPPEPLARLDAALASRLAEAAGAAMASDTAAERWVALLEAVVSSPVRRNVKPAGLPAEPTEELLNAARQQVGRVPALAGLLGISMPPPPGPSRPADLGRRPAARGTRLRSERGDRRRPAGGDSTASPGADAPAEPAAADGPVQEAEAAEPAAAAEPAREAEAAQEAEATEAAHEAEPAAADGPVQEAEAPEPAAAAEPAREAEGGTAEGGTAEPAATTTEPAPTTEPER